MLLLSLALATCFLAYANGANDNFKGVASLFGSQSTNYRTAISWATVTTFTGSICSMLLAQSLLTRFSGRGVVPDQVVGSEPFLLAVALGAGLTIMLATVTGFPVSTTHGLTGAILGSGLVAAGTAVNFQSLASGFLLPLVLGPILAVAVAGPLYTGLRLLRQRLGVTKEWCICIGARQQIIPTSPSAPRMALQPVAPSALETGSDASAMSAVVPAVVSGSGVTASVVSGPGITSSVVSGFSRTFPVVGVSAGEPTECVERYDSKFLGVRLQALLDGAHFISAGVVSFARGLNDTPKITAMLLTVQALDIRWGLVAVAVVMAIGGLLNAQKVAHTMSHRITSMNHGQGFAANLSTGLLVILASTSGLPVSTTHVSVGSLFGVGLMAGTANTRVIADIALSWVLTLPCAAILGGAAYWGIVHLGSNY